jgi:hypothetical protein
LGATCEVEFGPEPQGSGLLVHGFFGGTMNLRAPLGLLLLASVVFASQGCGRRTVIIMVGPPPAWVDIMPRHDRKLCALGYSGPTFYQTDCLKNAADNARGHLSQSISVSIKTLTLDISDGTRGSFSQDVFVEGSQCASDTVLNGSEVEAQYLDTQGQRGTPNGCYSMVCIDSDKPIEKLVQSLEDKKIPKKTVEQVRNNAAAAFEELEKAEANATPPEPKPQSPSPPPESPANPPEK